MDRRLSTAFVATMVIISILFLLVVRPYYGAVFWALILALLFQPLYMRLLGWFGGRSALASLGAVVTCILLVVIPFLILVTMIAAEAARAYQLLTSSPLDLAGTLDGLRNHLPASVIQFLDRLNLPSAAELAQKFSEFLQSILQFVAKGFYALGQGALSFAVAFGVALYLLYFFFKDGSELAATIRKASPLSPHQTDVLMQTITSVLTATVKGNFIIAAVQGAIGGVTLWFLGIGGAVLWGVVMAALSLIPAIGAGLIWFPIAVYLLLTGSVASGVILLVVGFGVISLVDNLLRPRLVGGQTNMPDYIVLVSTLGGLSLLGVNGFVIGPLVAALFLAVWRLYMEEKANLPDQPEIVLDQRETS
ncbi:AI-2E family transporter [Paracoccus sp. (in: a-proteobacteria)]|uniref:AI-2E family transporter n=1 Tax=Paracoccus sp. TaxID=267 RepID=UPI002896BC1D|nr:AI-2E family transporter [Paracoccus sp. (in: a-proteobacteria)]